MKPRKAMFTQSSKPMKPSKHKQPIKIEDFIRLERQQIDKAFDLENQFNCASAECANVLTDQLCSYVGANETIAKAYKGIGNMTLTLCDQTLTELAGIPKAASTCKSVPDVIALQYKIAKKLSDNYLNSFHKMSVMFLGCCEQALLR